MLPSTPVSGKNTYAEKKGYGLALNQNPHEDVFYEGVGVLRCHSSVKVPDAPHIAAAWLGTICSLVEERGPTEAEEARLFERNRYGLESVGFFHARASKRAAKTAASWLA